MKKHYDQVYRFHAAAGVEMPDVPTMLPRNEDSTFYSVRIESVAEAMKEDAKHYDKNELRDRVSYMLEELSELMNARTIEDQADALIDLMYFAIGTFTLMGVNPAPLFDIVANANLGKVMPDGTVLRDEQGKIRKPDGWHERYAPEGLIKAEIERQSLLHLFNDVCCEKAYVENVQVCKQCQEEAELLMSVETDENKN